jgi:hypothetical protein
MQLKTYSKPDPTIIKEEKRRKTKLKNHVTSAWWMKIPGN